LATLYVGSSPGPRRSYVRAVGNDAIFSLELAAYDVPVQLANWEDKTVLHLSKSDIKVLDVAGLHIEQAAPPAPPSPNKQMDSQPHPVLTPPTWEAKGLESGRPLELKADAVDKLTQLLADLSFEKVLGRDLSQEYGLEKPLLTITLTRKTGDTLTYLLGKNPMKDNFTLKTSNRPEYFRIPSYRATALLEAADRKQLLNPASVTPAPTKS
jgi:Domain of unknown function (DUF4340)